MYSDQIERDTKVKWKTNTDIHISFLNQGSTKGMLTRSFNQNSLYLFQDTLLEINNECTESISMAF